MGWVVYYLKSTKHSAKCPFSMYCLPPNWYNFFPALNCTEQHSPTIAHKCRAQKHSDRWTDERPQESALITARLSQSVNNDISFMHQRVHTHARTHTHTHTQVGSICERGLLSWPVSREFLESLSLPVRRVITTGYIFLISPLFSVPWIVAG